MTEICTLDLYVIYSKGINGMSIEDYLHTSYDDAVKAANESQARMNESEKKYIQDERRFTKFYVTSLYEYIQMYGEEMRWEGENRRE